MIWHSSTAEEVLNEFSVDDKNGLSNGMVDMANFVNFDPAECGIVEKE